MSDVISFEVAMRNAARVLLRALVVRDFLPSRVAAQRAHDPEGKLSVDDLEALIIKQRDISIANRICMARTDHGHHCRPPGHATVATSIDRATELIMRELGQEHAASDRARRGYAPSSAAGGDGKKSKSRCGGEERLPEMAFMTVHEVAVAVWKDIGVPSIEAAEILIRDEHALRMATYEGRPARVCPVTGAKCHPLIESAECPRS